MRIWIDLESGTYGDARNLVLVDVVDEDRVDELSDAEIIELGRERGTVVPV